MKVFLDECVDWRLARDIIGHDVKTARQMGSTTVKNGALPTLASQHFDAFVTVDRNLSFQENLDSFSIAVVVLQAKTNRLADLRPLIPGGLAAIEAALPGTAKLIGTDYRHRLRCPRANVRCSESSERAKDIIRIDRAFVAAARRGIYWPSARAGCSPAAMASGCDPVRLR